MGLRGKGAGLVALAVVLIAPACATTPPREIAFHPGSTSGLLVVVHPGSAYRYAADFRRVELGARRFLGDTVSVSSREGRINGGGPVHLTAREVETGDYALVGLFTARGAAQAGGCLSEAAPVFPVRAGAITVVRADQFWRQALGAANIADVPDATVLAALGDARFAAAEVATPSAVVEWERPTSGWTRDCADASVITPIRSSIR